MPKTTGERWMGVSEAGEYLGIGMRTLYKFLDQGLIPAYKLGRVIRIKRADVDAFSSRGPTEEGLSEAESFVLSAGISGTGPPHGDVTSPISPMPRSPAPTALAPEPPRDPFASTRLIRMPLHPGVAGILPMLAEGHWLPGLHA